MFVIVHDNLSAIFSALMAVYRHTSHQSVKHTGYGTGKKLQPEFKGPK